MRRDGVARGSAEALGIAFRVGDDEYVASVLGMDEKKVCLLMRTPVSRPLSLAEAIDVRAAQVTCRRRSARG